MSLCSTPGFTSTTVSLSDEQKMIYAVLGFFGSSDSESFFSFFCLILLFLKKSSICCLESFFDMADVVDGFYISPTDLCAAAEAWQADNFAAKKQPRSLRRLFAMFQQSDSDMRRLNATAKDLRRYGASSNAANAFESGFINPATGADSVYETPLFKALYPEDQDAQNSLADMKAQMQTLQQK